MCAMVFYRFKFRVIWQGAWNVVGCRAEPVSEVHELSKIEFRVIW